MGILTHYDELGIEIQAKWLRSHRGKGPHEDVNLGLFDTRVDNGSL